MGFLSKKWSPSALGLLLSCLAGLLFWWKPDAPGWLIDLGPLPPIPKEKWHKIGYLFLASTGLQCMLFFPILHSLRNFFDLRSEPEGKSSGAEGQPTQSEIDRSQEIASRRATWPPTLVGLGEAVVFPIALAIDKAEFIGLWLGLKVAAQWGYWKDKPGQPIEGRARFYVFLVGNLLSIMAAFVTYRFYVSLTR